MLVVTVQFKIKPESGARFFDRVCVQARDSLSLETGCRTFQVSRHVEDPLLVFLYEIYDDAAAFESHLQSEHFKAFDAETRDWVVEKVVGRWELAESD